MVRSLLILSCFLFSLNLSAQQKSRLGFKTGVNVAWHSDGLDGFQQRPVVSMHLTGYTEVQVANRLFLQPGLSLQGKGVGTDVGEMIDVGDRKVNMTYLEIPVNVLYKFNLPHFGKLVVGGGPFAALGLTGKERNGSSNVFRSVAGTDGYGNTDYGLNFIAGTELSSKFTLSLQQGVGFKNVAPARYTVIGADDGTILVDIKNRVSSVSIGYRF